MKKDKMISNSTKAGMGAGIITLGGVILSPLGGFIPLVLLPLATAATTRYIASRYILHEYKTEETKNDSQ